MSEDLGSPAEAAIAERRLKALMVEHDLSIGEIKRTKRRDSTQAGHEERQNSPARRKRTQSSVRWKQPRSNVWPIRIVAIVAMFGFVATLYFWMTFTGTQRTGYQIAEIFQPQQLEKSPGDGTPSLTTRVDRASVFEGESVTLYINGSGISARPNTSSLWQDFKIIATENTNNPDEQDFRIRIILQPRRTGTLIIPSFRAGSVSSELIIMNVLVRK